MVSNGHLVGALQAKHARFLIGQVQERTVRVEFAHVGIGTIP